MQRIGDNDAFMPLVKRFYVVDGLARYYQKKSFDRIHLLGLLTVLSTAFFSLFILFNNSLLLNVLYIVTTAVCVVMSKRHKRSGIYKKFIEYRCVAETMRVELFRAMAGLSDQFQLPSYGYMKNDFVWIRFVLKSWCSEFMNEYDKDIAALGPIEERVSFIKESWVEGQLAYQNRRKDNNRKAYTKSGKEQKVYYYITMFLSVLAIVITYTEFSGASIFQYPGLEFMGETLLHGSSFSGEMLIKLLMIFFVAISAYKLFDFSTVHGGTPEQITAKARMFEIARLRLRDAKDDMKAASVILYELGEQSVNENNDWAFEHKTKDFKEKQSYELKNLSKHR